MTISTYSLYYLETNIICIILLAIIFLLSCKDHNKKTETKSFLSVIVVTIIYCISDICAALFKTQDFNGVRTILYISNIVFIAFPLSLIFYWEKFVFYKLYYLGYKRNWVHYLINTILIIFLILDCSTPITHFSFSLDTNNMYSRELGAYLIPFVCFAYLLFITFKTLFLGLKSNYISAREDISSISLFAIPPLIATAFQIIFYGCTCAQVGFTISILLVFIQNQMTLISKDKLTGLNNRAEFDEYINSIKKTSSSMVLCLIDIDNFKKVNEELGYNEGDKLLQKVAQAITEAALELKKHVFVSRYEKDVFAIVINECSEVIKNKLEENISKNISDLNNSLQKSMQLTVSTVANFSIISDPSDVKTLLRETKDLLEKISNAKKSQINQHYYQK